jgi:hypothetical protein
MDTSSVAQAKRVSRGVILATTTPEAIRQVGPEQYLVASVSNPESDGYWVNLETDYCMCEDHAHHPEYSCKHIIAATVVQARIAA